MGRSELERMRAGPDVLQVSVAWLTITLVHGGESSAVISQRRRARRRRPDSRRAERQSTCGAPAIIGASQIRVDELSNTLWKLSKTLIHALKDCSGRSTFFHFVVLREVVS